MAAISLATDIGMAQPLESGLGSCLVATRLAVYLPKIRPCRSWGVPAGEDDLGLSGLGVLMTLAVGDYAMMPSHAAATGVPGYHQRVRVAAAIAGQ
jgi:hypothetical protein